ncbi:DUF5667 domain-containing protein [Nocardioides lijunqiniae]|uniref:DUF5667 domain-containing protein n=1 Tax=Nocardioides lijunqiniae TaxID=2760832 RepID=UPI001878BD4F|nr:DUF5667 domain-containing protein [Nocardioides lijunqiniae]
MIPAFTARRRAEEFSSLVDATSGPVDARYTDLLELVEALRAEPPVEARTEFVSGLRERLMRAADSALAPDPDAEVRARLTVTPRRTPRERRVAVAIGGFAIVTATTSMAVAAQSALPGDTLYPLKRALENARAGVQSDDGDRGSTLLHNASGRLAEADELAQDEGDGRAIADTLHAFSDQASAASDALIADYQSTGEEAPIAELRDFTADSLAELEGLESLVPDEARGALIQAVQVLGQIEQQAIYACPTCVPGLTQVPAAVLDTVSSLPQHILGPTLTPPAPPKPGPGRPGGSGTPGGKGGSGGGSGGDLPGAGGGSTPVVPTPPTAAPSAAPPSGSGGDTGKGPIGQLTDGIKSAGPPPTTTQELVEDLDELLGNVTGPLLP